MDLKALHQWKQRKISEGYAWDDEAGMPRYRAVAHRLCAVAGIPVPIDVDMHHIDHDKQNDAPTNLIMLSPYAHVLVHMATARWTGHEPIGNLRRPTDLLLFLDRARIAYLYLGSLVKAGNLTTNHNHNKEITQHA